MRLDRLVALVVVVGLLAATASAHPLHTSFAEADYNRAAKKLEVSLRVFADDFEAALGELAGQKISYEKTPRAELDPLIRAYLLANFTVKLRDGTLAPQRLIGRELKDAANEFWLYLEIDLPAGLEGVRVHSTLLRERFTDQLNSVRVRDDKREITLVFLSKQDEQTIRFP